LRGGSAISTRQISELPPTAIPNAAIALVIVSCRAEPQDGAGWCVAKRQRLGQYSARNVAIPFIDHSSEMWNFRRDGPLCPRSLPDEKGYAMKKTLMALVAVATLAVSAVAAPAPAHAQRGVGVGIAAGLLGGAIVGGAIASGNGYYGPGYYGHGPRYYGPGYGYYGGGPAYVADDYYGGGCVWQRQRFWDGYGWRVRRVRVCG
jgi:hypothetical protein